MKLIVSGASGFLGSEIIRQAKRFGQIQPVAVTSKADYYKGILTIPTEEFLNSGHLFSREDVFIHCLFPTNADGARMADGLQKAYRMIQQAAESQAGAFINISSQSVYPSAREKPAAETDALSLETPYAVGKYSTEAYTALAFKERPFCNIRLASLIGVGYEQRIINRMVGKALKGETLNVAGGMQRYGFLDVRDAAAGLIALARTDAAQWDSTYNLGRTERYTLLGLVQLIVQKLNDRGVRAEYQVSEGTDYRNSSLDPTAFMHQFGWEPQISIEQTIEEIIDCKMREVSA